MNLVKKSNTQCIGGFRMISNKRTIYVNQLPQLMQESIKNDILYSLIEMKRSMSIWEMEDALSSRLCDLEDIIDIKKYL